MNPNRPAPITFANGANPTYLRGSNPLISQLREEWETAENGIKSRLIAVYCEGHIDKASFLSTVLRKYLREMILQGNRECFFFDSEKDVSHTTDRDGKPITRIEV